MTEIRTLRPGLLVSMSTQIKGGVQYDKFDLETPHIDTDGVQRARWETRRIITDPAGIGIDLEAVADATDTFTGAEIAALVPDALFAAFNEDAREISTDDLLRAAKTVVPLARTADDKIKRLREFWAGRARPATSTPVKPTAYEASKPFRALDL